MFKKFHGTSQDRNGRSIHWHRASIDGVPFRGSGQQLLREEEFETKTETVYDCYYGTFDTSNCEDQHFGRTLRQVMEGIANLWYRILQGPELHWGHDPHGRPVMYLFVAWAEVYREPTDDLLGKVDTSRP